MRTRSLWLAQHIGLENKKVGRESADGNCCLTMDDFMHHVFQCFNHARRKQDLFHLGFAALPGFPGPPPASPPLPELNKLI